MEEGLKLILGPTSDAYSSNYEYKKLSTSRISERDFIFRKLGNLKPEQCTPLEVALLVRRQTCVVTCRRNRLCHYSVELYFIHYSSSWVTAGSRGSDQSECAETLRD